MPKGLKITNQTNNILFDSVWFAGVEYESDKFEDKENKQNDDYKENNQRTRVITWQAN
jgi:hypothetical protein